MKKAYLLKGLSLIMIILIVSTACSRGKIFEKYHKFENNTWKRVGDNVFFDVPIKDTTALYDIILAIRHATFYPYDKISVGFSIIFPSGESRYSEHNIILKDDRGKFISEGLGDIWDIEVPVKTKISFPSNGVYKFEIDNLTGNKFEVPGVMEIGLIIKKSR